MRTFYADHFLLDEGPPLSSRAFSTVRLATDFRVDEKVVLKTLHFEGLNREDALTMWHREADALQELDHPAVAKLIEQFTHNSDLCLVLEYIPNNGTAADLIAEISEGQRAKPSLAWLLKQLRRLVEALESIHVRGIIHRDLNPKNLLLTQAASLDESDIILIDFGIAKVLTQNYEGQNSVGTWYTAPYVAPEQAYRHATSVETDYYLLGMVMLSFLSLTVIEDKPRVDSIPNLLSTVLSQLLDTDIKRDLVRIVQGLLSDVPEERPRLPEVDFVLQRALQRVSDKEVLIEVSSGVKRKLSLESITIQSFLNDLSFQPMGRLEEDNSVVLLGRQMRARLRESDNEEYVWSAIDAYQETTSRLERARRRTSALPFRFREGRRPEEAFSRLLEQYRQRELAAANNREKRAAFFDNARFILQKQSQWQLTLSLSYEALEPRRTSSKKRKRERQTATVSVPAHQTYRVKLIDALGGVDSLEPDGEQPDRWHDLKGLVDQRGVVFYLENKNSSLQVGTPVQFDEDNAVLSLHTDYRLRLPKRGSLIALNVASRISLNRQVDALERFMDGRAASDKLALQLLEPQRIRTSKDILVELVQPLQPQQEMRDLVERIINADSFFLLQGPPGTGKTTLIAETVVQLLSGNPRLRILITSQSNQAVDNAMERIFELRGRLGKSWRIIRDSRDTSAQNDPSFLDPTYRQWCEEVIKKSAAAEQATETNSGETTKAQLQNVLQRWREELPQAAEVRSAFRGAVQVYGVTCSRVAAVQRELGDAPFDWVILDEAAKTLDTEALIPLVHGKKFLLVGDQKQLKPYLDVRTVDALKRAGKTDYHVSLFERLFEQVPAQNRETLTVQFRMHHSIGDFVGQLFYADVPGGLQTGVADQERPILVPELDHDARVVWSDVRGQEERIGTSYVNKQEGRRIYDLLCMINRGVKARGARYEVGIITPYRGQVDLLRQLVQLNASGLEYLDIEISTVDSFQGRQKDIILYSLVRTSPWGLRFPSKTDRLNVSFSRGKFALLIVGDAENAKYDPVLRRAQGFIKHFWRETPRG